MKALQQDNTVDVPEFKGYDIDELRYRRAYMLARCEIERMKLMQRVDAFRGGLPAVKTSGVASRLLKGLNYMDYAYLAYRSVSVIMKLAARFRRRR